MWSQAEEKYKAGEGNKAAAEADLHFPYRQQKHASEKVEMAKQQTGRGSKERRKKGTDSAQKKVGLGWGGGVLVGAGHR